MHASTILLAASLAVAAITFMAGAAGYWAGMKRDITLMPVKVVWTCLSVIVISIALSAARIESDIGPLVYWEGCLVSGSLAAAAVTGYSLGRRSAGSTAPGQMVLGSMALAVCLSASLVVNRRVAAIAASLGLLGSHAYTAVRNKDCPANLKSLYTAFRLYSEDYDALPPAPRWLDNTELTSKVTRDEWLHCPAVSNRHDDRYGYSYNTLVAGRKLNGQPLNKMPNASATVLIFDSANLSKGAADACTSLPRPGRHGGSNNVLYCDGHVEAVPSR